MAKLEYAGRYNGKIVSSKVDRTEKSGFWQFCVQVVLTAKWNAESKQMDALQETILTTAYLMLQGVDKETGAVKENQAQIDAIQSFVPEWTDTDDLEFLHKINLKDREVSVKVEMETFEGKDRLRITWVNARGGFRPTAPDVEKAMGKGWKKSKAPLPPKENSTGVV